VSTADPSSVFALWRARWSRAEADPDHTALARAWSRAATLLHDTDPEGFRVYCRAVTRATRRGLGRSSSPTVPWPRPAVVCGPGDA
jgi:hypothetical protein